MQAARALADAAGVPVPPHVARDASQSSMWRRTRPARRSVELALIGITSTSSKKVENLLRAVNLCFAHHSNGQVDRTTTPEVEMVDEWFVEFYPVDADRPEQPIYFDGFSATLSHIQSRLLPGSGVVDVGGAVGGYLV